ncbi:MAG: hypothetical protein H6741_20190 [Alphaproteobacteria bacterium]|nr:hypothetical protein [Alphaproteobacteria bacterium]
MSDRDEGVVLSQGRFRVDRKRALEKMERFQLEDPHRYVLELLAAAAAVDPEQVEVINDSDDFVISFAAPRVPGEELDGLFDHLWGEPKTPKLSMLQHIGLGVLGALGLEPKWVRVDVGDGERALRLDVKDPAETRHQPLTPPIEGVRVHVRERLSTRTFAEALRLAFQEPIEAQLVRGAARRYPARLRINGQEVPRMPAPEVCVLSWAGEIEGRRAALQFVPHELDTGIDILRHGLVVGHLPMAIGRFGLSGFIRDDALRLNASRSEIVRDERWEDCSKALHAHIDRWLCEAAPLPPEDPEEELRWSGGAGRLPFRATAGELRQALARAAVEVLARGDKELGALEQVPVLEDLRHDLYSVAQLRALPDPPAVTTELILDPDWRGPLFSAADETLLRAVCGDIRDVTRIIQFLAEGRERRTKARVVPPWFEDARQQRRFSQDALKGAISGPLPEQKAGTLIIRWSQGGRVVQTTQIGVPGLRMQVILDHPELETNLSFSQVQSGALYTQAIDLAQAEAVEFLAEFARQAPIYGETAKAAWLFIDYAQVCLRSVSRDCAPADALALIPECLREVPVLPRARGDRLSLRELLLDEAHFWWLTTLPPACPAELAQRIVLLPQELGEAWCKRFPKALQDGSEAITARLERERRMRLPRQEARVLGHNGPKVRVDEPELQGELGWTDPTFMHLNPKPSALLRQGVPVSELTLPAILPGAFGVIDWKGAPVSPAHDALAEGGLEHLQARLVPYLDQLALSMWSPEALKLPVAVESWLCSERISKGPPEAALARVIGRWTDGTPFTLGQLKRFADERQKGDARLVVVSNDPGQLPGYEATVVMLPGARRVFETWASGHVRSRDEDLAQSRWELARFLDRTPWQPGATLASRPIDYADMKGQVFLPVNLSELGPARAVALWQGRVLATRLRAKELGAVVVVEGEALKPTLKLDNVVDSGRLTGLLKKAQRALPELIDDALEALPEDSVPQPPEAWRRLLSCVADSEWRLKDRQEVLERFESLRLFPSLTGETYTPKELRAALEGGQAVRWVPATAARGSADHRYYLLDMPQVREAAAAWLRAEVRDGQGELEDWRAAQRRLATTRRVEAKLSTQHPHVQAFELGALKQKDLPPHRGELGLGGAHLAGREPGLHLTALFDGLPLEPVVLPFPIPLMGIVEGPSVRADRALTQVDTADRRWERLTEALLERAHAWLKELTQAPASDVVRGMLARWALQHRPTGPAREAPLFALIDGSFASLAELHARQKADKAVGVVTALPPGHVRVTWPSPVVPLLLDELELPALRQVVTPRLLDETLRVYRSAPPLPPPTGPGLRLELGGFGDAKLVLPYDTRPEPVPLRLGGVKLAELHFSRPLAVVGVLDDCKLPPTPFLDGVAEGLDSLFAAVTQATRDAVARVAEIHPKWAQAEAVPLMRAALRHLCAEPAQLRAAAAGEAEGLEGQLAALKLFERSDGTPGSLLEVAEGPHIRAVSPGAVGRALPGAAPFWRLGGDERRWLANAFQVVQSDEALAAEERGVARRAAKPFDRSGPLWGARKLSHTVEGVNLLLWLGEPADSLISVLVEGREVCTLAAPLPGLQGWIEGPFEVNTDFSHAALSPVAQRALEETAVTLLRQEASDSERDRLKALRRVKLLLGRSTLRQPARALAPFSELKPFTRHDGTPVSFQELTEALREKGKVWYVRAGSPVEPEDRFTLALSAEELPQVESLVGGAKRLQSLNEAQLKEERRAAERAAQEAAKKAEAEAAAQRSETKRRADAISKHLEQWGHRASVPMDGAPVLDAWLSQGAPDWVMAAEPDSPTLMIAAWKAAADSGLSNEGELALIAELAAALRDA